MSLKDFKNLGLDKHINTGKNTKNSLDLIDPQSGSKKKARRSKFNAKKVTIDGIEFDSTFEGERYSILKMLEKGKAIRDLELQVKFPIIINDILICNYIADFVYYENGKRIVEDAKGVKTPEYRLKKKLMKAVNNIDILETFKNK